MSTHRGLRVLAHPVVGCCLAGWWANDHVLKDHFHNSVTGKLSDVLGLVVFPLLLAAVLERFVQRPLGMAIGCTAAVFAAINLSSGLSELIAPHLFPLVPDATLTPDPTDLVVLPVLFGSWWLWERTPASGEGLLRAWGVVVLALGLGVTMASGDEVGIGFDRQTEIHRGSFVLEGLGDSVDLDVKLVSGAETLPLANVAREFDLVPMGRGPADGPRPRLSELGLDALPGQGRAGRADLAPLVEMSEVEIDDSHIVRIELVDDRYGPVIVEWSMQGDCGELCDPNALPALFVAPANPEGRATFVEVAQYRPTEIERGLQPVNLRRWTVTMPSPDHRLFLHMPYLNTNSFRAASDHQSVRLGLAGSAEVDPPVDCGAQGCVFHLWVAGQGDWGEPLIAYATPGVEVVGRAEELVATKIDVPAAAIGFDVGQRSPAIVTLEGVEPLGFPAEVTTYVDIVLTRRGPEAETRQGFTADYANSVEIGWRQRRGILWGTDCCAWPTDLVVEQWVEADRNAKGDLVGEFMGSATLYTLEPIDRDLVSLRLSAR